MSSSFLFAILPLGVPFYVSVRCGSQFLVLLYACALRCVRVLCYMPCAVFRTCCYYCILYTTCRVLFVACRVYNTCRSVCTYVSHPPSILRSANPMYVCVCKPRACRLYNKFIHLCTMYTMYDIRYTIYDVEMRTCNSVKI